MTPRTDEIANIVTGLGGPIDKSQWNYFQEERRLKEPELNNLYEGSGLAARIIDRVVDDATRSGFRLTGADKAFDWASIASEIEDLAVVSSANKACKTARLYGGALLVMEVNDGGSYEDPLDLLNASELEGFSVFPSNRVMPDSYNSAYGADAYLNPEWYLLTGTNSSSTRVHRSRCIRVDGVPLLSPYRAMERGGWGPSVLERVFSEIARLEGAEGYAAGCMHDISVLTLKLPKLHEMMCGGDDQKALAQKLLEEMVWTRDQLHINLLGPEDVLEEVKRDLSGFDALIERFANAVIREENMPRTILLGEQPGGLGSSASDEVRGWYDHVSGWQARHLTRIYKRIMEVLFAIRRNNLLGVPEEWTIAYDSLWQPDEATQASTLLTSVQAYQILQTMGIMGPDEIKAELLRKGLITESSLKVAGPQNPEEIKAVVVSDDETMASTDPVPPDLCSTKEAAAVMGVPTLTVNLMCRRGTLRYWQFGKRLQVSMADVLAAGQPVPLQAVQETPVPNAAEVVVV